MSNVQSKPLVILLSRNLTPEEKHEFHKHYTSVININKYNTEKKVTDFTSDSVVIIDIRDSTGREYWAINSKLFDANDSVIWVRASGDENKGDDLKYKYECKKIHTNCKDKQSFLFFLYQSTFTRVVGTKKRFLRRALSFLFGCARRMNST